MSQSNSEVKVSTEASANAKVLMYTTAVCPYCARAKQLLKAHGVINIEDVLVDIDPKARQQMLEKTGKRTVPQIFIGDFHVGGYDDLVALNEKGDLDRLLLND